MKNAFLILGTLLLVNSSIAQEKISDYTLGMYKDKVFDIQAAEPESNGSFDFYIDVPAGSDSRAVSLIVANNQLSSFVKNMDVAKGIYTEWKNKAIENNVQDVSKVIETDKLKLKAGFLYGSSWNFDFSVQPVWKFRVLEGKPFLIVSNLSKLQSSSNRYIDSDGFVMVFSDEAEIDTFLSKLTEDSVKDYFASKKSSEDIFTQKNR